MSSGTSQRIFLVPELHVQKKYKVIRLKHPRTDEFSSWLVEESVTEDGSVYLLTVADPLFFILPYVNESGKFCPLEDLLMDESYPDTHYLSKCCSPEELLNIFDSKETAGYKVFCFSKIKTIQWLQQKVKNLANSLEHKSIYIADGSKASCLQENDENDNHEKFLSYSCCLMSEYLSDELTQELFMSFGLQKQENSKQSGDSQGKSKKQNTSVSPTDDYSKTFSMDLSQNKQKSKLSAAQKRLLKGDKSGMKNISSFFQKK